MKTAPLSPLGFRVILIGSVKHEFVVLVVHYMFECQCQTYTQFLIVRNNFLLIYMEQPELLTKTLTESSIFSLINPPLFIIVS
jgi:hypothetical protein